jgi:tetratricopeptide (TPR) repeat protein
MTGIIRYSILLFVLNILLFNCALSQETEMVTKLRLATSFEEADEWERAVTLYEELYKSDPMNYTFLNSLQRSYTHLKEYEKAISLIRRWFIIHPRDLNLLTTLGGLYYDSGNEAAADSVWKSALSIDSHNVQSYRIVANEMMQHRLYEQCIKTYLDGRSISNTDVLFADELGALYAALQQYSSAAQEYLRLIKKRPEQLSFVQSRLSAVILKPEALRAVSEAVNAEVKASPETLALHRLYVWLLMEERRYDTALEHYRIIDRLSHANGNELYAFAQRLNQEHIPAAAAQTYEEILNSYDNNSLLPFARLGYARALEDMSAQADSLAPETQPSIQKALQMYESIAMAPGYSDLSAQALFRIGVIKFEHFFDLDDALMAFSKIKELPYHGNVAYDAALKIGEVYTARNDLASARKEFEKIAQLPLTLYQDQAIFRIAELYYFEAQFDTSLSLLKRFTINLNTDLSNDALQLQYFIQENKTSSLPALGQYTKADLFMRQRKYSESLNLFRNIIKQYPDAQLIDDALMKIGALYIHLKKPDEAIAAFQCITDSIHMSILKDKAQFRIAEISEYDLHNKVRALESYEKLLERFPNSLYAEQARKRVRILRGDAL